jgi:hypothetical protein
MYFAIEMGRSVREALAAAHRSRHRPSDGCVEGQQRLEVLDGFRFWQLIEQAPQICIRLEFIGACGLHQAVEVGACLGAAHRIGEQANSQLRRL